MSEHPPDFGDMDVRGPDQTRTAEYATATDVLSTVPGGPDWFGVDHDDDEEWVSRTTRGIRLAAPVALLLAVVLVAAGFWGGVELEKNHAGSSGSSGSSLASLFAARRSGTTTGRASGAGRLGGLFGGGTGSTAAAAGTISVVDGGTLYVRTTSGSLVKVTLTKSATITRNADATAIDLRPNDTITVQGATGKNGTVTATSVSATAPGVSSGFAGFGTGGAPGSSGTGSSTTPSSSTGGSGSSSGSSAVKSLF